MDMSAAAPHFDVVIAPPRSLSSNGFSRFMLLLGCIAAVFSAGFVILGAYPVVGFFGAEIMLLWLLMRRRVQGRGPKTCIRIGCEEIEVRRLDIRGREWLGRLPAHFARIEHDNKVRGPEALRIVSRGRSINIGEHLLPEERASLATRLRAALTSTRKPTEQPGEIT